MAVALTIASAIAPLAQARSRSLTHPTPGERVEPPPIVSPREPPRAFATVFVERPDDHALPGAAGDAITLHFTVTAEGEVTDAAISGDADPDVGDCLSRVMASWHFQPAAAAVQVNYPLRFARTARTAPPSPRAP